MLLGAVLTTLAAAAGEPQAAERGDDCASCHAEEVRLWQTSDHAKAMASSQSADAVLGDFDNAKAAHFDLKAEFHRMDDQPVMTLIRGAARSDHPVSHVFGVSPLQQYLTTQGDKRQVLPFAWDARPKAAGGQRWMTLHPEEDILPGDRLHWQGPLSNWNGMCADCHSTGFKRNYDPATNRFASSSTEVNVACGSCHGTEPHTKNPIAKGSAAGFQPRFPSASKPAYQAAPQNQSNRDASRASMEICAACHSLRAPLTDGIDPSQPFLDQFTPVPPEPTLYFPDGQIREEVYVWGSFQQSKMHALGVTCGNCHEPHSQRLKAEGNALCSQCHSAEQFDTQKHHNHPPKSAGAQCANCHMPARTYMVVDDRRDHSFRIPDLIASKTLGSPDACTSCHTDKDVDWAIANLRLTRSTRRGSPSRQLWENNQAGMPLTAAQFQQLTSDSELPELLKASAISQQARLQQGVPLPDLQALAASPEPLISIAAIQNTQGLDASHRASLLAPMLTHRYRAVRVAAANQLRDSAPTSAGKNPALVAALAEADAADKTSAWRGEGLMNMALNRERSGDTEGAIDAYRRAIKLEPQYEPAYINLTEIYRRSGNILAEQLLYSQALNAIPRSGILHYSYALHLVRHKNPAGAAKETQKALEIEPGNESAAYLHLLLLDSLGQTRKGIDWLQKALEHHKNSPRVLQLGAKHAQKLRDVEALQRFMQALQPNPPRTEGN